MNTIIISELNTPLGELVLGSFDDRLCLCDWKYRSARQAIDRRVKQFLGAAYTWGESEVNHKAEQQLIEYLQGERLVFDIPLLLCGSPFQVKVWKTLQDISYGKSETYQELSRRIKNEKAVRAVAAANGANALAIFIPCHRIVGQRGRLTGYAGGLTAKKKLLRLEQRVAGIMPAEPELFD